MSFKNLSTVLLVIAASLLLVTLAFKIKVGTTADYAGKSRSVSKGCCGSGAGGCASNSQMGKGEVK